MKISFSFLEQQINHDEQELQELRAKIRALEAKRADDSQRIRELESRLTEAKNFVSLFPKLQNLLQTNLIAMRHELADFQQLAQLAKAHIIDAQEQLEIVMLDKEVVGKRAELTDTELEDVRARAAIPEVENNVLKEGSVEISLLFGEKLIFGQHTEATLWATVHCREGLAVTREIPAYAG